MARCVIIGTIDKRHGACRRAVFLRAARAAQREETMLQIRQIRIGDYRAAYRLIRQAFGGSNISDGHEQDWVIAQRSGK